MSFLEKSYIENEIGYRLNLFKRKGNDIYNFRCPFCGDSKTNKTKARGYFYKINNIFRYKCHNGCEHSSLSFKSFLKLFDNDLYKKYLFDRYSDDKQIIIKNDKPTKKENNKVSTDRKKLDSILENCSLLEQTHLAKIYLNNRMIPEENHDNFYYIDNIQKITKRLKKYKDVILKDSRIIIPYFNRTGDLVALSGRSLDNKCKLRYFTIRVKNSADEPLIFNLDKVDFNKTVFVTEGPFDSTFFNNSLAVGGSDFAKIGKFLKKDNTILIFDNQCRNKEVMKNYYKFAEEGWKIFIFPNIFSDCKDINDIVMKHKLTTKELEKIVIQNSFSGLTLLTELVKYNRTIIKNAV